MTDKNPVSESMPSDWSPEMQIIAKDTMQILVRHYPGWIWQIEFTKHPATGAIDCLIVRLGDVMTDVVSLVHYKDIDRDRMTCAVRAGGELLEALGLSRSKNRHEDVRSLKTTPAGLIVPAYGSVPEINPGYEKFKIQDAILR